MQQRGQRDEQGLVRRLLASGFMSDVDRRILKDIDDRYERMELARATADAAFQPSPLLSGIIKFAGAIIRPPLEALLNDPGVIDLQLRFWLGYGSS